MHKPTAPRSDDDLPSEDVLRRLRVPLMRRATLTLDGRPEEVFVIDLALGGAFIERSTPLPAGTAVGLRFSLPGNEIPLLAECRVESYHAGDPGALPRSLPAGADLVFTSLPAADAERVRSHLTEYYQREPRSRRFVRHVSARRNEGGS